MAQVVDGVIPSLLQGVSQQIPRERLPGQVGAQLNMVSDLVTGIRRRPGIQHIKTLALVNSVNTNSVQSKYIELDTTGWHVYLNALGGTITAVSADFTTVHSATHTYLATLDGLSSSLGTVVDGDYLWVLNKGIKPALGATDANKQNPGRTGFAYARTGAFSKSYAVTITATNSSGVSASYTKTYTTPTGTADGDAAKSNPAGIAEGLYNLLIAADKPSWLSVEREGAYLSFHTTAEFGASCTVSTSSGSTYLGVSGTMQVNLVSDLPPNLPTGTTGFLCAVGTSTKSLQYYRWDGSKKIWYESGDYAAAITLTNMPVRISIAKTTGITITTPAFEGRVAGDDENNPYPQFIGKTLTGISAYQGRLVLMSGAYLNLSAANKPLRFMRSTVTQLLSEDAIERGSGSATAASYHFAVPYNRDLIAISSTHQSVVPASTSGLTPASAVVLLSTKQALDVLAEPMVVGRSLMYCTPISADYFGIGELSPSDTTASQYVASELTNHIPRYMKGRCRGIASSSAASIALFTSSVSTDEMLVHEYLWAGSEKIQNSWHKWTAPMPILAVHFAKDILVLALQWGTSGMILCTLDTRDSAYYASGTVKPLLDLYTELPVVDVSATLGYKTVALPNWLTTLTTDTVGASSTVSGMVGEPVEVLGIDSNTLKIHKSYSGSTVVVGFKYKSALELTPPIMKDYNGRPISLDKTTVLRFAVTVQNTGDFDTEISTPKLGPIMDDDVHVLRWASHELGLRRARVVDQATVIVPCRTIANETSCVFSTDSTREMNIVGVEYTLKTVQKRQRI